MRTSWERNRGFSLVELLTVIAIIALIISIILPVLAGVRESGRKVATAGLLNDIAGATNQFRLDHQGQNPGYFSPKEMGSAENGDRGMSQMENVLLDLAGTGAIVDTATASTVEVGPIASQTIFVDPSLIGASGSYFTPSGEYYVAQLDSTDQQWTTVAGHAGSSDTDVQLRDMVDAFGQPLLFWSADTYTMRTLSRPEDFVEFDSAGEPSLFYWTSNAAFLHAANLGRKGEDMTIQPTSGNKASTIGYGAIQDNEPDTMGSLMSLLGSPSAPQSNNSQTIEQLLASPSEASIDALYPGRAKGAFVVQSAGIDGIYLSTKDRGFKTVSDNATHLEYGLNFFFSPTARVTDDNGKPTSRDIASELDDLTVAGGG